MWWLLLPAVLVGLVLPARAQAPISAATSLSITCGSPTRWRALRKGW